MAGPVSPTASALGCTCGWSLLRLFLGRRELAGVVLSPGRQSWDTDLTVHNVGTHTRTWGLQVQGQGPVLLCCLLLCTAGKALLSSSLSFPVCEAPAGGRVPLAGETADRPREQGVCFLATAGSGGLPVGGGAQAGYLPLPHTQFGDRVLLSLDALHSCFLTQIMPGLPLPGAEGGLPTVPHPWTLDLWEAGGELALLPACLVVLGRLPGSSRAAPSTGPAVVPGCTRPALQRRERKKTGIPERVNMRSPVPSLPNTWALCSENVGFFQASEPLPVMFLLPPAPSPLLTVELLFILQGPRQKTPLLDPSYSYLSHGTHHPES